MKSIKKPMVARRNLLMGAGAAGLAAVTAPTLLRAAQTNPFTDLETRIGGLVGVGAFETGSGQFVGHWPDMRFAMCSTFKWLLAAQCLAAADQGALKRDDLLTYTEADLLDYAPVAKAHLAKGGLSVVDHCKAIVEVSDNTCANLLLARMGGPAAFTAFCRALGDTVTRLDRTEPSLNTNFAGDQRDTTTPRAMAQTLQKVLLGDILTPSSRDLLVSWMVASTTGRERLRAGLPKDWKVGDKTGTGARGAINDVAIAWPPGRPPLVIAVYLSGSRADLPALNAAHAEIARLTVKLLG